MISSLINTMVSPNFSRLNVSASILSVTLVSGCAVLNTGAVVDAEVGQGWELVWSDEFAGTEIDTTKWGYETNCWGGGNNELQCYTDKPDNAFIRDEKLVIHAKPESFTGPAEPIEWDNSDPNNTKTLDYTSARLRTAQRGDFGYGRIEVNAKVPGGQGIWPAIWMLPTDYVYGGWAASGEIDIMEAVNLGTTDELAVHGTLHYGGAWPANKYSGTDYVFEDSDPREEFHTYAVEWAANEIRWYIDDVHYATQRSTGWYAQITNDAGELENLAGAAPFDQKFHLLLNVAVGGNWPGSPNEETVFPSEMEVDFVRVYTCPESPESLIACATKNPRAKRVFGNEAPEIVKADYDPDFLNQDTVTVFADEVVGPFALDKYVANGAVTTAIVDDAEHGTVTRIQYDTDESVVYYQSKQGFDFSEFSHLEFDLKVVSDARESEGLVIKMDCFHPCSSGNYPIQQPSVGSWVHYKVALLDLVKHPGSTLDLTNVNTPFVVSPDWGNQTGVVLHIDNVLLTK